MGKSKTPKESNGPRNDDDMVGPDLKARLLAIQAEEEAKAKAPAAPAQSPEEKLRDECKALIEKAGMAGVVIIRRGGGNIFQWVGMGADAALGHVAMAKQSLIRMLCG